MKYLKNHPFAVKAYFKESVVLTYALPKSTLERFIPGKLSLDSFQDEWAFIAVAMVDTTALRPAGFPEFLGRNFFLIGYRIFVRYTDLRGKSLRGLYILKSETNKKSMEMLGNIFTNYQYTTTDIQQIHLNNQKIISSRKSGFQVKIGTKNEEVTLPESSPFSNWKEARKFAGPLPHTFNVHEANREVLIIRGLRQNWTPQPIPVLEHHFEFLKNQGLEQARLASAFRIENIPYHWEKGRIDKWS